MNKKLLIASLAVLGLLLAFSGVKAAPAATYQEWNGPLNKLVVYSAGQGSSICFQGKREDYNGVCTLLGVNATSEWREKQSVGVSYVDLDWNATWGNR